MKIMGDVSKINPISEPGLTTFYERKRDEYANRRYSRGRKAGKSWLDETPKYGERLAVAYWSAFSNLGMNLTDLGLVAKLGTPAGAYLLLETISILETRLDQISSDVEDLWRRQK